MDEQIFQGRYEIPVGVWLYGVKQPRRIGCGDASESFSSSASSTPSSANLETVQELRTNRKLGLENLLHEIHRAVDLKPLQNTDDTSATLDAGRLSLELKRESGNSTILELSLICSDLMWAPIMSAGAGSCQLPGYILAIAPKASLSSQAALLGKAWLLCVDQCCPDTFHQVLFEFGRAGAIRWDFEEHYKLEHIAALEPSLGPRTPFLGKTFESSRFAGKPEVVAVKLAGEAESLHNQLSIMARFRTHPNILKFHGAFYQQEGESFILTFDHAPRDLATRIQLLGPVDRSRCLDVLYSVLTAAAYLHYHRVVHRNICLDVVRFSGTRQAVIAGVEAAVSIDDHKAMQTVAGIPGYVAPEAIRRQPYGVKVDIFSAGAIYFTALTGQEPFRDEHEDDATALQRTLEGAINLERPEFKMIPYSLQFLVKAMLRDFPRARPSAADAADHCWQLMSSAQAENHSVANYIHTDLNNMQQESDASMMLEGSLAQHQDSNTNGSVSRSSSISSVRSGAFVPESVLEQQARLPNLAVLDEGTSSQERSSRSSSKQDVSVSSNSSPQVSSPHVGNSQSLPDLPERQAGQPPQSEDPAQSLDVSRDGEVFAHSIHLAAMTPTPGVPPQQNDLPLAATPQASQVCADQQSVPPHRVDHEAAAALAPLPSSAPGNQVRPPVLDSSISPPALASSSSSSSLPWPVRALSHAVRRARRAGNSVLRSMRIHARKPSRVDSEELSSLVPQGDMPTPQSEQQPSAIS